MSDPPVHRRPLRRVLIRLLVNIVLGYAILCGVIACIQRKMIYFPDTTPPATPTDAAHRSIQAVELTAEDGVRLAAWYWPGRRPVNLVIFHGNAGHRGHRLEWIRDLHDRGLGVFILDYRGYGGGEGSPTEEGLYLDAEASVRWLEEQGAENLVYLGESLGSGVAVETAVRRQPAALIIQSGFSSMVDAAAFHYPYLPVNWLLADRYENDRKIGNVSCPVLVVHGEKDTIVPAHLGRKLFDAAAEPRELYLIPAANHNDLPWVGGKAYLDTIDRFLNEHVQKKEAGSG